MEKSGVILLQYIDKRKLNQARTLRRRMTEAEQALWVHLRTKKLSGLKFRRQQIIEGFIADFFCEELRLVIEIDAGIHQTKEQKEIDEHRREVFKARGLREIRFSNEEVLNRMPRVLEKICRLI